MGDSTTHPILTMLLTYTSSGLPLLYIYIFTWDGFGEVIVMKIVNKNFVQEVLLDLVSYRGCRSTYRSTYRSIVVPMVTEVCR